MIPAIFPLLPIRDGKCVCKKGSACKSVGKCPGYAYSHLRPGQQLPIPPGCGYGIATGSRSGFFVVDLDIKDEVNGVAEFLKIAAGRPIPPTHETESGNGRGGVHLRFLCPVGFTVKNSQSKLGPGIDIRGEGGFVVGAGSPHKSGGVYRVTRDLPSADAPAWLLELIQRPAVKAPPAAPGSAVFIPATGDARADAAALLRANWPTTRRHLAQLALVGACIRGGWTDDETVDFVTSVCGDRAKREQTVADTRAKHLSNEPYTGFGPSGLELYVASDIVDQVRKTLNFPNDMPDMGDFELEPPPPAPSVLPGSTRRVPQVGHVYSHAPGINAPREKLAKSVPMSDLIRRLLGSDDWKGVWQYDEFKRQLIAVDPPMKLDAETTGLSATDVTAVGTWFEAHGIAASDDMVGRAIHAAAKSQSFHPVREYLMGLPRRPVSGLLDTLALRVLGNPSPIANTFLKLFLVSAVRRILWPGTKVDTMLVLYSPKEGRFKSTFAEVLFGVEWFRDQMPSLDGRDASHALEGSWGIEIPELDRIMRAETSTTKEFLSRRTDKYRAFGTGSKVEYARQCVFIGTTNYPDFLESDTGNRRFWPIEVFGAILLDFVKTYRDAIWAEAVVLALDPAVKHWLDEAQEADAAETRVSFDKRDMWHEAVEEYCRGKETIDTAGRIYLEKIAVGEDGALARAPRTASNRIAAILRKLSCVSLTRYREDGTKERFWKISEALKNAAPSPTKVSIFN